MRSFPIMKSALWLFGIVGLVVALMCYWNYEKNNPSTDDAYIQAHITPIAPQVTGKVSRVYVLDNQIVHKGQPLFDIDAEPFQLAVDKNKANLHWVQQQVAAQHDTVKIARAQVEKCQVQVSITQKTYQRIASLVSKGRAPQAEGDTAKSKLLAATADLNAAKNDYQRAMQLSGETGEMNAQTRLAKAQLQQTELALQHAHVVAPSDGKVTQLSLRLGMMVNQNQALFSLVGLHDWWVKANFKETALANIHPQQTVTIQVDMYPGIVFHGVVDSIGAGSDSVFSIFPPENATGNWVKVTQRMPVKITVLDPDPRYPLRIGASSKVTISTKSKA